MLFVMGVGFLLDSPLIVFHSMCVFRLWSNVVPNRCWPLRGWKTRPKNEHHPTEEDGQIGTNHSLPLERGALFNLIQQTK